MTFLAAENLKTELKDRVVVSSQAGGIMVKVLETVAHSGWTFASTRTASLEEVVKHADFKLNVPLDKKGGNDFFNDDQATELVILQLSTLKSSIQKAYSFKGVKPIYRTIGKKDPNYNLTQSALVIEKALMKHAPKPGDVIYSDQSTGYLEKIEAVSTVETSKVVKTKVLETSGSETSLFSNLLDEEKQLECIGGEDKSRGLSLYSSESQGAFKEGKVVIGRASGRFAIQVTSISEVGKFRIVEGYPVLHVEKNGEVFTTMHSRAPGFDWSKVATVGKLFDQPFDCAKIMETACPVCKEVKCNAEVLYHPSVTLGLRIVGHMSVSNPLEGAIGLQAELVAAALYHTSFKVDAELSHDFEIPLLPEPIPVAEFEIQIGPVPVPGSVTVQPFLHIIPTIKYKTEIESHGIAKFVDHFGGIGGEIDLPMPPYSGQKVREATATVKVQEFGKDSVSASLEVRAVAQIFITWPDLGRRAFKAILERLLPSWLMKIAGTLLDSFSLSAYIQGDLSIWGKAEIGVCKCCHKLESPHKVTFTAGPGIDVHGGANVSLASWDFPIYSQDFTIFNKDVCMRPKLSFCKSCSANQLEASTSCSAQSCPNGKKAIQGDQTQGCECPCTCPNGKPSVVVKGKCRCDCECLHRRISKQIPDPKFKDGWRCDCSADCPKKCSDGQKPMLIKNGCLCPPPSLLCGVSPGCEDGRIGASCSIPDCSSLNWCGGPSHGTCVKGKGCRAVCKCKKGYKGKMCKTSTA